MTSEGTPCLSTGIGKPLPRASRVALVCGTLVVGVLGSAEADDCNALGGSLAGAPTECRIDSPQTRSGTFNLNESLHILGGGKLTVPPGSALILNITGDLIVEAGSEIEGDASGAQSGATIIVNATEDILLRGDGTTRESITADHAGPCGGSSTTGGVIKLTANADAGVTPPAGDLIGNVTIEANAVVSVNGGGCPAGQIIISGVDVTIDGTAESASSRGGTGGVQRPGGGPITVDASCTLRVTGTVSSRGRDPGADLVHLEGGCAVQILGLVESTGSGHAVPNNPVNHCNSAHRPDKPSNATGCVEIWAGKPLTGETVGLLIDSTGQNRGEINADVGGGGPGGTSWIDLFVEGDFVLRADSTDLPPVHANGTGGDVTLITVKSNGAVTMSGPALRADGRTAGGVVMVEGAGNVTLDTAGLLARGDFNPQGGLGTGGAIAVRSFTGDLSWQNGVGDVRPNATGTITLTACGSIDVTPSPNFNGEVPTPNPGPCNPTGPTFPAYVGLLPVCLCGEPGVSCIEVTKECTDAADPGGPIAFSGTVTNCGNVPLTNVTVTDDHAGPVLTLVSPLAPGDSANYSGSYVPQTSPSTNEVTATGTPPTGGAVTDTAQATCKVTAASPCIEVTKECTDAAGPGGSIAFSGTVTNCGNVPLTNVTVTDDHAGPVLTLVSPLAPGDSANYSGSYVPQTSPSTNEVTAMGTPPTGGAVTGTAQATCEVPPPPPGSQGCTLGFWKQDQHFDDWPTGFAPGDDLDGVFIIPACLSTCGFGDDSLLDALNYGGGSTLCAKARILLKQAVAAVLNAAHPDIEYPIEPASAVVTQVNNALASCSKSTMVGLAEDLDDDNNLHNNDVCE